MFGVDELIVGRVAKVFQVVNQEWVAEGVVRKEDDLGAACCKILCYRCSNAGSTSLQALEYVGGSRATFWGIL